MPDIQPKSTSPAIRRLLIAAGILVMLLALASFYLLSGTSDAQALIHYDITIQDPSSSWVDVAITLVPAPQPFADLYLREPVQDGRARIADLRITRAGKPLAHWQAVPGFRDVLRLWNGFSTQPVTITYRVDPLWMKGPNSPRSYLGADLGYLRGMVFLYSPLSLDDILHPGFESRGINAGFATAEVHLPEGWQMVSPYGSGAINTPASNLRNGYFGFGRFAITEKIYDNTPFLMGIHEQVGPTERAELQEQIPALFETMKEMTGFAPVSGTCFWSLAIVPVEPIHGGASGTGSLVAQNDLDLIAHEMFHWWNGATLQTTADANWFKEGFTTYYAAKALHRTGIWTDRQFAQAIKRFQAKAGDPVDLTRASLQLARRNDPSAYDAVYHRGALLAYSLDMQLTAQGKSLDMLWPSLSGSNSAVSTEQILTALEQLSGEEVAQAFSDALYGKTPPVLPASIQAVLP